jgi:hypothetical protein
MKPAEAIALLELHAQLWLIASGQMQAPQPKPEEPDGEPVSDPAAGHYS